MEAETSRRPTDFLDLPLELRRQIYGYCLVDEYPIRLMYRDLTLPPIERRISVSITAFTCATKTRLRLVSKAINSEALEVFYGQNVFQVDVETYGGLNTDSFPKPNPDEGFTEANLRRVRKLQILLLGYDTLLHRTLWPSPSSSFLAQLTSFTIVAQRPRKPLNPWDLEIDVSAKEWKGWLQRNLQPIFRHLPSLCTVEVDDDNDEVTNTTMDECLPSGYRNVRTLTGDVLFRRNAYLKNDPSDSVWWPSRYLT